MEIHGIAYFRTFNPFVVGSTPAGPTKFKPRQCHVGGVFLLCIYTKQFSYLKFFKVF